MDWKEVVFGVIEALSQHFSRRIEKNPSIESQRSLNYQPLQKETISIAYCGYANSNTCENTEL